MSIFNKKYLLEGLLQCETDEEIEIFLAQELARNDRLEIKMYGIDLLGERFEDILENLEYNELDPSDVADIVFEVPQINGSLTYSTAKSKRQLLANYNLEEIIEKSKMYGDNLSSEQLHIVFAKDEFLDYFYEVMGDVRELTPDLSEKEMIIATCLEISKANDLHLEDYDLDAVKTLNQKLENIELERDL